MQRANLNFTKFHLGGLALFVTAAILWTVSFPVFSLAQQKTQKTFSSAEAASNAFAAATAKNDEEAILEILGPEGKQIVSSGDPTEDAEGRATFTQKYEEMHRLVTEPNGTVTLYIGPENWPTPIPILNKGGLWYFDTEAGKQEILQRRIGGNELSAIRICQQLVAAQKEFYSSQNRYAEKVFSDEGQHNGLYWKALDGQPNSPIGPLVANAFVDSSTQNQEPAPVPYRGYYLRLISQPGKGSAVGFAFVAFPAEYLSSGVVTFIVNADGVVYQRDLGKKTAETAKSIQEYKLTAKWQKVEEEPEQVASSDQNK